MADEEEDIIQFEASGRKRTPEYEAVVRMMERGEWDVLIQGREEYKAKLADWEVEEFVGILRQLERYPPGS